MEQELQNNLIPLDSWVHQDKHEENLPSVSTCASLDFEGIQMSYLKKNRKKGDVKTTNIKLKQVTTIKAH